VGEDGKAGVDGIPSRDEVDRLLANVSAGDERAKQELFGLLYSSLHRQAQLDMARQPAGHTLQATALVNEVFLRFGRDAAGPWTDRSHFLKTAARAMRQILVDHARRKNAAERAEDGKRDELEALVFDFVDRSTDVEALNGALERLEEFDAEMAQAVELRFFAGRRMDEIADVLGIPKRSLERRWAATRAWLYREVK